MQQPPNTAKDRKALALTLTIHGVIILLLILSPIAVPQPVIPPPDLGIEVNLGNSDQGFGDNQPLVPGDPAPVAKAQSNPAPQQTPASAQQPITPEENNRAEDQPVNQPVKHTHPRPVPENREVARHITQRTIVNPTPAPRRPKAVYQGGNGTGGNDQDAFNRSNSEGIAGGRGDQGSPNGNPNSHNYTGNGGTGTSGVQVIGNLHDRGIRSLPSFRDDFDHDAKVAVDITVDASGHVTSALYSLRHSTTSDPRYVEIAQTKALQIKFAPSSADVQTGTLIFNFKVSQ